MARVFLCGAYSYGSLRTSKKEYLHNSRLPIQVKTALFVQDVVTVPFMLPIHIFTDLKIEYSGEVSSTINHSKQVKHVQLVPKKLLHLHWVNQDKHDHQIIYTQVGESTCSTTSFKQGSCRNS